MPLQEGQTAVYRALVKLAEDDLKTSGVLIQVPCCDDHGWYYVNGKLAGESHDWQDHPSFELKPDLHPGENVIVVGVRNDGGVGGLNPNVSLEINAQSLSTPWSRSLFNGLAQIIVQSTKDAGEIKLTATADGLAPATITVNTQPSKLRPFVP